MSLLVLHLSDLHITDEKTGILNNSKQIAQSAFLPLRQASACLIIVTGDVAYSGAAEQFVLAEAFLDDIREALKAEGCPVVDIVVVPGNHDCVLTPTDSVRSILIDRVVESPATAEDLDVVTKCTAAQQNFFDFRGRLTRASPCFDHPLWTEYELLVEGRLIRVSAINAAWMSRIPERPGQLVFPVNAFQDILSAPAQLRLALIHHPLNWYAQSTYHDLRKNLRRHCSAILSGHEHLAAAGQVADAEIGTNIYFEADSLNPHESSLVPGYSLMSFEFAKLEVEVNAFRWQSGRFQSMSLRTLSFAEATYGPIERSDLMRDFECILRDPGGVFTHPDKEEVKLDDVFVFPELIFLDRKDKDDTRYSVSSEELLFADPSGHRLLLVGEDKAGKTALLYRAFLEYHALGYWPLYVPGSRISLRSGEDISKILSKVAGEQYRDTRCFGSAQKLKKIALVDDIDRLKSGPRSLGRLVQGLENHFGSIVLTASQGFEIRELVSEDAAITLSGFQTLEFMRFGHALRHRMITRWCQLASWSNLADLDREIHAAEHLINSVLGKNLAPSLPIYLLVLLQSYSQQQQGELQNNSFARYYEYLIIRSLVKAGVRPDSYDEMFNYLSQLAWYFRETEIDEATHAELRGFNRVFSERFTTVDLGSRLELLVATRLLIKRGDSYEFAYPYIYYFFLGRWLARNLDAPGIKGPAQT